MAVTKTSFKKGEKKPYQGKHGENHLTKQMRTVKEVVLSAFNELQKDKTHNIVAFAKKYPKDFYNIASKLIPNEFKGSLEVNIETIEIELSDGSKIKV